MSRRTAAFRALLSGLLVPWLATSALAGLEVCNDTDAMQSVAIGYKGDRDWTSEGWWNVDPGDCALVVGDDLTRRYYYYYAESDDATFEGQNYLFCAQDEVFEIVGDTDCENRGFETLSMREVDTGESALHFTLRLVDDGGEPSGGDKIGPRLEVPDGSTVTSGLAPGSSSGPGGPIVGAPVTEVVQDPTVVPPEEVPLTVSMEDLITDIPPGRHGKNFVTEALFQGCELHGGREFCSFHADGLKMRVFYRGPTPEDLLFALEDLAVNMPVKLEGDLVEETGRLAAIVVRAVVPVPGQDGNSRLRAALQGDWIDQGDRRWEMTVHGSELFFRRDGEFSTHRYFRLAESCVDNGGSGPVMVQVNPDTGLDTCYLIGRADGQVLELTDVRRGGKNVYRRVQ